MTELDLKSVWIPAENAAFRRIKDEVVIVDTSSNKMMTLNQTGSEVWSMLGDRTVQEVAQGISDIFDVVIEEAKTDVLSFLASLKSRGLIELKQT